MNHSQQSIYSAIGGETTLRRLVARFYLLMDELPEAQRVRALHAPDLSESAERLFEFLSGWLGGPPLFAQRHGHPQLRRRHAMVRIGQVERDQWMLCMIGALELEVSDDELRSRLVQAIAQMADHLINAPDAANAQAA